MLTMYASNRRLGCHVSQPALRIGGGEGVHISQALFVHAGAFVCFFLVNGYWLAVNTSKLQRCLEECVPEPFAF